jgi:hypothetical protein
VQDIPPGKRHTPPDTDGAFIRDMFASQIQPPRADSPRRAEKATRTPRAQSPKTCRTPQATARPISCKNLFG